tara:strand:- start:3018 stop:3341 length:324 start_codon:yes stop_codon:yes gene_type:complete
MTILIQLLLIITVSVIVGYPLFSKMPRSMMGVRNINTNGLPHLLVQKEVAYATLKDLDFDYKTGKLSNEDYQALKTQYEKEAIGILEKIDTLSKKQSHPAGKRRRKH